MCATKRKVSWRGKMSSRNRKLLYLFFLHTIGTSLCEKLDVPSTIKLIDGAVLHMKLITYSRKLYVS